jgi:hypothetical protein
LSVATGALKLASLPRFVTRPASLFTGLAVFEATEGAAAGVVFLPRAIGAAAPGTKKYEQIKTRKNNDKITRATFRLDFMSCLRLSKRLMGQKSFGYRA